MTNPNCVGGTDGNNKYKQHLMDSGNFSFSWSNGRNNFNISGL